MSDPNSFVSPLVVENFKMKALGLKVAAIGGFAILGGIVIAVLKIISTRGISNFRVPSLGAGGFLGLLWVLAILGAIGYLSFILWKKSAAMDTYVQDQSSDNLTQVLLLQKQFYQTLALIILGSYGFFAFITLIA
jgi:hypothetical protein